MASFSVKPSAAGDTRGRMNAGSLRANDEMLMVTRAAAGSRADRVRFDANGDDSGGNSVDSTSRGAFVDARRT